MQVFCVGGKHFPSALGTVLEYALEKIFYFLKKNIDGGRKPCMVSIVSGNEKPQTQKRKTKLNT
jgi:hypothetical protein